MNVVCLVGRLTADPELRQTPNGTNVCSFSVAVNRAFANANGERQADFINCVAWRQTAEFISILINANRIRVSRVLRLSRRRCRWLIG